MFQKSANIYDALIVVCIGFIYLLCVHYFQQNIGGDALQLPFNVTVLGGILLLAIICFVKILRTKQLSITRLSISFLILTFTLLLPVAYTNSHFLYLAKLKLYFVMLLPMLYLAFNQINKNQFRLISNLIVVSVLIEVLYGYAQLFVIGEIINAVPGRPTGIFQQPNVFGTYMAMGICLSIYNLLNRIDKNRIDKYLYQTTIVLSISILPLTESKVALLSVIFGLISIAIACVLKKNSKVLSVIVLVAIGALLFFGAKSWLSALSLLPTDSISTQKEAQITITSEPEIFGVRLGTRSTIFPTVFSMLKDNPLQGYGLGSFNKQYLQYQAQYLRENPGAGYESKLTHPHNELLLWWVEGGLLSAISLILIIAFIIHALFRGDMAAGFLKLAVLSPFLIHNMTEYPFYHSFTHLFTFMILVALFDTSKQRAIPVSIISARLAVAISTIGFIAYLYFASRVTSQISILAQYQLGGARDPTLLSQAPQTAVYQEKLALEIMSHKLFAAVSRGNGKIDKAVLTEFVNWAERYNQYRPNINIYINAIHAWVVLGDHGKAQDIWLEAISLFPADKELQFYKVQFQFINSKETSA